MFYVYEHYKKDTDEIFYVGIGKIDKNKNYIRAGSSSKRNSHWCSIVKKHGFYFKIVFESDSREDVCNREIDLITLYGRKDLGTGPLCNKTCGGEKTFTMGKKSIGEGVKKRMENGTYNKCGELARERMLTNNPWKGKTHNGFGPKRKIYQYDLKTGNFIKEWETIRSAYMYYKCNPKVISWVLCGKRMSGLGFLWYYEYKGEKIDRSEIGWKNGQSRNILEINDSGDVIKSWQSIKELSNEIGITTITLSKYLKKDGIIRGRIFKFGE